MFWMAATALIPGWAPPGGNESKAATKEASPMQFALMYGALYTIAVGTGGIKPNVSSFGADQFDDTIREERKQKQSFFNWFYFSINVGSLIAVTVIVKIQVCCCCHCAAHHVVVREEGMMLARVDVRNGQSLRDARAGRDTLLTALFWPVQEWSWGVGFAIPAVAMALAVVLFVAGRNKYTYQEAKGSPLERLARLVWGACCERTRRLLFCRSNHDTYRSTSQEVVRSQDQV
jgi:dipeptide/tripeptide permease